MIIKADIAQVSVGPLTIEGLMSENADFGVAVPQLASVNLVPPNRSVKQLESLLGEAFQSHSIQRWKTPLNPKAVNVIPLDQFQALVRALDKKGNPAAGLFVDVMLGLSLHQLFADAFGIKFEAENRQRWLNCRLITKADFRDLTDCLKACGFSEKSDFARYIWAVQTKVGFNSGERDSLDLVLLDKLRTAQVRLITMMDCGVKPWDALRRL